MTAKKAIKIGIGVVAFFLFLSCLKVIEDGQAGVKHTLGKINDTALGSGLHFVVPVIQIIERWNIKKQEIKESANVPSSEGLISSLDVSVVFRLQDVAHIRKTIGRRPVSTILIPYTRDAIRAIVSGYTVKALFSDSGRTEISFKIKEMLMEKLPEKAFIIEDVLLRDVVLPATFTQSIENKMKAEQEALQKQFELQKAVIDADIEVARAHGVAEANKIIGTSLKNNEAYLRYLWIQSLHDEYGEIIYIPTEANMPILEAGRFGRMDKS